MKKSEDYLMKASELLGQAVYHMCREALSKDSGEAVKDPKFLKEVGTAIKEAVNAVSGLEKKQSHEDAGIRIIFETDGLEK